MIPAALSFSDALSILVAGLGVGLVVAILAALTQVRR